MAAFDYPGYGLHAGEPSESSLFSCASAVYRHLCITEDLKPENLIVYGYKLG